MFSFENYKKVKFNYYQDRFLIDIEKFIKIIERKHEDRRNEFANSDLQDCQNDLQQCEEPKFSKSENIENDVQSHECFLSTHTSLNSNQIDIVLLAYQWRKYTLTKNEKKQFDSLWQKLESRKKLVFIEDKLIEIAQDRTGLSNNGRSGFYINDEPYNVNEDLIINYLQQDNHLLRSPYLIEYIKFKIENNSATFLQRLRDIICPQGTGHGTGRPTVDKKVKYWIFAYINYFSDRNNKSNLRSELSHILKIEFDHKASVSTINNWHKEIKAMYEILSDCDIKIIVSECLTKE